MTPDELLHLVEDANAERWPTGHRSVHPAEAGPAGVQLERAFEASTRLAAYGTLAPGRSNHHVVSMLGGRWEAGIVEGVLHPVGWGATQGFPAFRPRAGGDEVPVQLLTAPLLPAHWERLDLFEGEGYRRILVPVWSGGDRSLLALANLYAAA